MCEWVLHASSFQPDVICFNLLIDAYGQKSEFKKAESIYLELLQSGCVPTDDTYALLLKAYCKPGLLEKAEAVLAEMKRNGHVPGKLFSTFLLQLAFFHSNLPCIMGKT